MGVAAICFSDPGCPWAYSANPALSVLAWRYGDQLDWQLRLIGLTERPEQYEERGYTPVMMAHGYQRFRRYGMPFSTAPRVRVSATGRACRAVVAARLFAPGTEWSVYRALQFGWFTTTLVMDQDESIERVLEPVDGVDARAIVAALDSPEVSDAYEQDRRAARTAAGSPSEFQDKTANTDGNVRYTAPSLVFEQDGKELEAGGFQPVEAYDVLIANLDPTLSRRAPADSPMPVLDRFPHGVTTQEVAAVMARGNDEPDRQGAEEMLIELAADGSVRRVGMGDDAVWLPGRTGTALRAA